MNKGKNIKFGILALAIISILAIAADQVYSRGGRGYGCCGGQGYGNGNGYRGHGYHHGIGNLNYLEAELGLSEDQVKKVFDINTRYRDEYFKNRGNCEKVWALHVEHRRAVENILTEAQKVKFKTAWPVYDKNYRPVNCPYRK